MKYILSLLILGLSLMTSAQNKPLTGKQLFGSLRARHLGPTVTSGRVTDIEPHPTNNNILYVGTAGGGVWKTMNAGVNFKPIFDKHNSSIGTIALDPKDPDHIIWVGTGETWTRNSTSTGDGLYRSTDGGNNWKKMGFENSERISSIQIDPKNTNIVYVAVLGHLWGDDNERGVYKTTDNGKTWKKILAGKADTGISDLIMDPNNHNVLYAAFWQFRRTPWSFNSGGENSALYKTTDAGKTWKKVNFGVTSKQLGRIAITVAPSDSNRLYAVIEAKKDAEKGLYVSDNAGKTWKKVNGDFAITVRPFYFARLVVDPKNKDIVAKAAFFASISTDGGKTFKNFGDMHADIHDIVFDKDNSDRMYFATDGGFYFSLDKGVSNIKNKDLNVGQYYFISVDNETPYNIYGGLQDNGSWWVPSTASGGVKEKDWNAVGGGDGFRVYRHPTKKIIYSEYQAGEWIGRYDMEKQTIRNITPFSEKEGEKLRFNWNPALTLSPNKPDRVYVGSQYLHKSDDMGNNWTIISPDLTTNDKSKQNQDKSGGITVDNSGAENNNDIFTIAESPLDENVIWVGTDDGYVQITTDGGKNWTNVTKNIPGLPANSWVYHIEAGNFDKKTAYAVFDRHTLNDKKTYVYKTTDWGRTWQSIVTDEIKGFARNIQEDYVKKGLLFLGTEDGLYITINGGKNWMKFENNMPTVPVHFIALQKKTNDLVLGTHGRGAIVIDDISPLREVTDDVLKKDVYFFKTKPFTMYERENFGGGYGTNNYVAPGRSGGAKIIYYLKKRHTFGKMSMSVLDDKGNEVVKLTPTKQKGVNIVRWYYRSKIPKSATGKTLSMGSFAAPRVPAGTYTIRMKKGKKVYETKIQTKYDTLPGISLKNRKIQEKTIAEIYDMIEDLAYLVYQNDEMIKYAKELKKLNGKLKKPANQLIAQLNTLKKSLVQTTGDNYTQTPKPELREKISKLYSNILGEYDLPSNSQMKNLKILKNDLKSAHQKFEKIKKKYFKKLVAKATKYKLKSFDIKSFKDFTKK